jgi:colicin import membrane protein
MVHGRLPSHVLRLHLEPDARELRLYDPRTGKWLPTTLERADKAEAERAGRLQAEAERQREQAARQQAEAERQREQSARLQAEAERQKEQSARLQAEAEITRLRQEVESLRRRRTTDS